MVTKSQFLKSYDYTIVFEIKLLSKKCFTRKKNNKSASISSLGTCMVTSEFHEIYLFFYEIFKGKKVRIIISVLLLVYSIPYNS